MDKYEIIRKLGLQVFTKPLGTEVMLVSADELAEVLDRGALKVKTDVTVLSLEIPPKPKTLKEEIQHILSSYNDTPWHTLTRIRNLVEKK